MDENPVRIIPGRKRMHGDCSPRRMLGRKIQPARCIVNLPNECWVVHPELTALYDKPVPAPPTCFYDQWPAVDEVLFGAVWVPVCTSHLGMYMKLDVADPETNVRVKRVRDP